MAEPQLSPQVKNCPICTKELPISEFGRCRARKDGRNLYCKPCIREKVTQSRRALKEYKAARKKYEAQLEATIIAEQSEFLASVARPIKLSPVDRVRLAIERG